MCIRDRPHCTVWPNIFLVTFQVSDPYTNKDSMLRLKILIFVFFMCVIKHRVLLLFCEQYSPENRTFLILPTFYSPLRCIVYLYIEFTLVTLFWFLVEFRATFLASNVTCFFCVCGVWYESDIVRRTKSPPVVERSSTVILFFQQLPFSLPNLPPQETE